MAKARKATPPPDDAGGDLVARVKREIAAKKMAWEAGQTTITPTRGAAPAELLGLAFSDDDLTRMGAKWRATEEFYRHAVGALPLPPKVDWRDHDGANWVKDVRQQGSCMSCVAFATVGAVEANVRIACRKPDVPVSFSEAFLFACGCNRCCGTGWNPDLALEFCKQQGLVEGSVMPYQPTNMMCPATTAPRFKITDWDRISTTDGLKSALKDIGPVVWGMRVFQDFLYSYVGGVYRHAYGPFVGNHAILLVGYDDAQGCWICKNSWGQGWGTSESPKGYFRIAYGDESLRGTIGGKPFAFDAYSVKVACPTPAPTAPTVNCQQYVPELKETILAARQNPALNAYLKYWVCGVGNEPPQQAALHQVAARVRAVVQACPDTYRTWFCENL